MSRYIDENGMFHMKWGLVKGRHEIPDIDGYIFDEPIENPLDFQALAHKADEWAEALYSWLDMEWVPEHKFSMTRNELLDLPENEEWNIHIYVTGLTSALIAVLGVFNFWPTTGVTFWHYDRDTGEYVDQICPALTSGY
tara:strand:+ start:746 stop:1162 length:417 start_codon:yes stop_codon:yes gene_type:complete